MSALTVIAAIWLICLAVGIVMTVLTLFDAMGDLRWLRDCGHNGARLAVAKASVRTEALRLGMMACFTVTGLATLLSRVPRGALTEGLIFGGLIAGVVILMVKAVLERRARQWFIHIYSEEHQEHPR